MTIRKVFKNCLMGFGIPVLSMIPCVALASRPDGFSASTVLGSDLFIQSFLVNRHFSQPDSVEDSFFARKQREREEEEEKELREKGKRGSTRPNLPTPPYPLSWELGYLYTRPTVVPGSSVTGLDTHGIQGGLNWEALPVFEMGINLELDTVPDQSYRHGQLTFRFEYFTSLKEAGKSVIRQKHFEEDDEDDARAYYLKHSTLFKPPTSSNYLGNRSKKGGKKAQAQGGNETGTEGNDENSDADDDASPALLAAAQKQAKVAYPQLRAALVGELDRHILQDGSGSELNQFAFGPDLVLGWNEELGFHLTTLFYGYTSSATNFSQLLPASRGVAFVLPQGSLTSLASQILSFPRMVFEEGVSYDLSENWAVDLTLNQVFYAVDGQPFALGFSPVLTRIFGSHWEVGVGGDWIVSTTASSVLGLLNLNYLF